MQPPGSTPDELQQIDLRALDFDAEQHTELESLSDSEHTHSSATTDVYDFDQVQVRSASPGPSIYSVTSSIREDLLINVHGRLVNNHSNVYHLPADDEEIDRLGNISRHPSFLHLSAKSSH